LHGKKPGAGGAGLDYAVQTQTLTSTGRKLPRRD
jgi:hypothetical protein